MIDDLARLTPDLDALGWDEELERWAGSEGAVEDELARGRIARVSRGFSLVFTGGDAVLAASGSMRLQTDLVPATGDYVIVAADPEDGPSLAAIAPRRSALSRRAAGRVPEPQVLAANVDDVFVMQGLDREINLRRIERQLVVSWDSGAEPIVVLTKSDQIDGGPDALADAVTEVTAIAPGVTVLTVSTVTGQGVDAIADRVRAGRTVAMMGLSGIGKSTLVNALTDGEVQRTGEVRAADRRGRHTTVTRDLIPIPTGGFMIDTPGIREIGLWQAYDGLARTFPEISEEADRCRFADCEHRNEPGCAVRAAQAEGLIPERRLDHWRDLMAELALQETQLEEFARRSESRDRADAERRRDAERPNKRSRNKSGRRGGGRRRR
ncbi:MAG: ribosome small subunit-dependent GTPase A [Actinomycetota bacterium]